MSVSNVGAKELVIGQYRAVVDGLNSGFSLTKLWQSLDPIGAIPYSSFCWAVRKFISPSDLNPAAALNMRLRKKGKSSQSHTMPEIESRPRDESIIQPQSEKSLPQHGGLTRDQKIDTKYGKKR
jgi:hypothetical protein